MPRWASRIDLEVTEVRVQRVQEISEEDARAEGVEPGRRDDGMGGPKASWSARYSFQMLWDSINSKRPGCAWADSPWVWCISFRRVRP